MNALTKAATSNIANTVWPTQGVPDPVKDLISLLLQLLDDKSDEAGPRLAEEVFTSDGQLGATHKSAKGSAEIREARRTAWVKVDYRAHQVTRVYTQSDSDFLFIGNAQMRTRSGHEFKEEFIGRVIVDYPSSPSLMVKHFNVWIDTVAFDRAMQNA